MTKLPGNLLRIAAHSGRIGIRRRTEAGADGIVAAAEAAGTAVAAVAVGSLLDDQQQTGGTAVEASSVAAVVAGIAAAVADDTLVVVADVRPAASVPGLSRATPAVCLNAVVVVLVAAAAAAVEDDVSLGSLDGRLAPPLDQSLLALHARSPPAASGGRVTVTDQIPSSSVLHRCCRRRLQNSCFPGELS